MVALLGGAIGALLLVSIGILALLWTFAVSHPWHAAFIYPFILFMGWRQWRKEQRQAYERLDARMRDEHVPSMSPTEYEKFVARELQKAGWSVTHCGAVGDQGCDVVAELRGFKAVIQAKLYRKPCGNQGVQQIVAARMHYNAQVMAVVCPAGFTASAQELALSNGVHLMDHGGLKNLAAIARIP